MATGIEIAGVALGAFPVLVQLIDTFIKGVRTIKKAWRVAETPFSILGPGPMNSIKLTTMVLKERWANKALKRVEAYLATDELKIQRETLQRLCQTTASILTRHSQLREPLSRLAKGEVGAYLQTRRQARSLLNILSSPQSGSCSCHTSKFAHIQVLPVSREAKLPAAASLGAFTARFNVIFTFARPGPTADAVEVGWREFDIAQEQTPNNSVSSAEISASSLSINIKSQGAATSADGPANTEELVTHKRSASSIMTGLAVYEP